MIPSEYTIVESYMMNPGDSCNTFQLLTRGLRVIREFTKSYPQDKLVALINSRKDLPLLRQLLAHGRLIYIVESAQTYKDLKHQLMSYSHNFRPTGPSSSNADNWSITFVDYIEELIYRTRAHQKSEKALEESVVCAYSPIVPYVGTLKVPFVGERVDDEDEPNQDELVEAAKEGWTNMELFRVWNHSLKTMYDMAMNHYIVDDLILNADMIRPDEMKAEDASSMAELARIMYRNPAFVNHRSIIAYALWAFIHEFADSMDVEKAYQMAYLTKEVESTSFNELFDKVFNSLRDATEADLNSELENYNALNKFMKDPSAYQSTNTSSDPIEMFDLTQLMNFIFTNRRFRANHYTNSAFMNMPSIGGYVFYKDFLIIQPETADGQEVNFLYVPVVDDLNGSKVVVLKFWRNNHIDILSEAEYMKETQGIDGN